MIEEIVKEFLDKTLDVKCFFEHPDNAPKKYILIERISGNKRNHLKSAVFAFQSYATSLYEAAQLNENLKTQLEKIIGHSRISSIKLNSDYNFTDTQTKKYRYQAVFDIYYY